MTIEISKQYLEDSLGLVSKKVAVVASDGGMTLIGQCRRRGCKNLEKVVDISPDGKVETLMCTGRKDDCLGE